MRVYSPLHSNHAVIAQVKHTHTHTPTPSNPKIKEENSQTHTHKTGTKLIVPFRLYFKASGRETYPGVTFVILFCVHEEFIGCIR